MFIARKEYSIWMLVCGGLMLLLVLTVLEIVVQRNILASDQRRILVEHDVVPGDPPVRSSEDFHGEKSHFTFSPDQTMIAFVQNVFKDYGYDWEKYWALKIFNPSTGQEKVLFVDDTHLSSYTWLNNKIIRVFHGAGTGVRVYRDIVALRDAPLFTKNYRGEEFWAVDEAYVQEAQNYVTAESTYRVHKESLNKSLYAK